LQEVIGKKEIMAILEPSRTQQQTREEGRSLKRSQRTGNSTVITEHITASGIAGQQGPSLWVIIMAVVCTIALMLPLESEEHSDLPHYLLLSVNQKLLAAFILGLITMAILRT